MKPIVGVPTQAPSEPFAMDWMPVAFVSAILLVSLLYLFARGRASSEARAGLVLGLRGLLGKELRSRSRGWRPMLLLTGYLSLLTVAVAGFLGVIGRIGGVISPVIGTQLFSTLAVAAVLLLAFITPALTVGAVSGERERRTLDLLLVTRASPLGLVGGKLAGSLFYVLFLMLATLPAFALVYLFGGVPAIYLGMVLAVAAVTALAHASLGLFLSALLRRTIVASIVAYLLVLFAVFGIPFVSTVSTTVAMQQQASRGGPQFPGPPPAYTYVSPLSSLPSVLPSASPSAGGSVFGLMGMLLLGIGGYGYSGAMQGVQSSNLTQAVYVVSVDQATGQPQTVTKLAPWVYNFAFSAVFSFLCIALTALLLAPVKPWRAWRFRRRAAIEIP